MSDAIDTDEFVARIERLCIGGDPGLPRRVRDLHILLASATLWLEPDGVYTEQEISDGLQKWLDEGCPSLQVDVVTLRRELIDRVFLNRDDWGRHYSPGPGPRDVRFSPDVATVDPATVIGEALGRRKARKRAHATDEEK